MKRIFTMLLIACSVITTASANISAEPQKKPEYVIAQLNYIARTHGQREGQTYSINKNPNTGIIESSQRIVPIAATMVGKGPYFNNITQAFMHDEPLSYQFLHIEPGSSESFALKVITNNGEKNITLQLRTNKNQELWFMCCKNSDNPQLRDAYAIVWEVNYNGRKPMDTGSYPMKGTIYMITSLRPDLYTKDQGGLKNVFKIEGRVDANIKDSLYNIYIADTGEELANIGDDDYIACVPVINKRFEWQTELDHRCVGRLRCIFPDGSLCSAWINLDFVPGETYSITVHNGWYDEDRDFERRVGRNSGKSLLTARQSAGNDDVLTVDTVPVLDDNDIVLDGVEIVEPEDQWESHAIPIKRGYEYENVEAWTRSLTAQQQALLMFKAKGIEDGIERVKASYKPIGELMKRDMAFNKVSDKIFENIAAQNKELDKSIQEFQKALFALNPPMKIRVSFYTEAFKEILNTFTEQNKGFTEMYAKMGSLPKSAQKTQKYITKLTEKYANEMMKNLGLMK